MQDQKLVSAKQKWEPAYIARKYKIPIAKVREALKTAGRSRERLYMVLQGMGYLEGYMWTGKHLKKQ